MGFVVVAMLVTATQVGGQEQPLGTPTALFPEDFGRITNVRELSDGRVLVADPLGQAVYLVDLEAGSRRQLGANGQGPGEYRAPDSVWPLPHDSTLLVDLGNGRLTRMEPNSRRERHRRSP